MKAAVIRMADDAKVLQVEDFSAPQLAAGQVLVRVRASGICGSDLHGFLDATGTNRRDGLVMGHETAGDIAAVGEGVTHVAVGDRVTVDPQVVCGVCEPCRRGWISICDNKRVTGSSLRGFEQGSMGEYIAVAENQVYSIPADMDYDIAAMIEPLSNAAHVVNRADVKLGDTVVIVGAGTLGLCMLQCVVAAGASRIVVSDTSSVRLDVARSLGAHITVNPTQDDLRAVVSELTAGRGADVVIESVGIDITYQDTIHLVRKRGRIMFFGAVQPTVTVDLMPILHKEITILGCTGANEEEMHIAINLVRSGVVDLRPLITHQFALADADRAFRTMADPTAGSIKVQILP